MHRDKGTLPEFKHPSTYLSVYLEKKLLKHSDSSLRLMLCLNLSKLTCSKQHSRREPYLRDGAVVPDVALVGEQVGHVAQFPFLHILFNRI